MVVYFTATHDKLVSSDSCGMAARLMSLANLGPSGNFAICMATAGVLFLSVTYIWRFFSTRLRFPVVGDPRAKDCRDALVKGTKLVSGFYHLSKIR